ncbi:MAG: YdeI/OmpD-associated family protein [Christensenellaceae bacterium]|jgi:uncharacterized protein YdeI (YjbR/CyaY-like superfamily)|nr:YdeI/OmpD-associated family protein [Christensenellaceae bacterium]
MKNEIDSTRMTRQVYDIPDYVIAALEESGLWERYKERPPYQQNDYIGWIGRAKRLETRNKRIGIMLTELNAGGVYMGMKWAASGKR